MIILETERYYQPIPFEEYKDIDSWRPDSFRRYRAIFDSIPPCKSLIDLCCANGYFLFKFIQEGGIKARGVEINQDYVDFINHLALEKKLDVVCTNGLIEKADVGLYLDTYDFEKHTKLGFIEALKGCKYVFVSTCKKDMNEELRKILKGEFKEVSEIYRGYQGRIIYKCEEPI